MQVTDVAAALDDPRTEVTAVELAWDDLGTAPSRWANGGIAAPLEFSLWYSYLRVPDRRPILAQRMFAAGNSQLILSEVGPSFWELPRPMEGGSVALGSRIDPTDAFYSGPSPILPVAGDPEGLSDDIVTWEARPTGAVDLMSAEPLSDSPQMLYRASSRHARTLEAGIFDVRWDYMPYALCIAPPGPMGPYCGWAATITGTFKGLPIAQTGGFDRLHGAGPTDYATADPTLVFQGSAVGPDGERELAYVFSFGDGRSAGLYWKDGEDPVVSNEVETVARYVANPDEPEMIAADSATFRFGGKEITWSPRYLSTTAGGAIDHWGEWRERNSPPHVKFQGIAECKIPPGSVEVSAMR